MVKISSRCSICQHPQKAEIHRDVLQLNKTYGYIHKTYFPTRSSGSVGSSCTAHFKKHYNLEPDVAAVAKVTVQLENPDNLPAIPGELSPGDRVIFTTLAKERIDAIATVETLMQVLMDKINFLEKHWENLSNREPCDKCGANSVIDIGPMLKMSLECMKELRELSERWIRYRDPMETMRQYFAKTFSEYTSQIVKLYVGILQEKSRQLQDTVNQYLKGEIIASVFARRIADFQDMETQKIAQESSVLFKKLLSEVMKEFK